MRHDLRRLTLEQMRAFLAIIDGGGFQRAGSQLHRSQSAITHSLQKLEEGLQCQLVVRRQGHIKGLTEAGHRFASGAREVLAQVEIAVELVHEPELKRCLRVGVVEGFEVQHLVSAIKQCTTSHTRPRLDVISDLSAPLMQKVEENNLDLAVVKRVYKGVVRQCQMPILVEPLCWIADHDASLGDYDEVPLVVFAEGCTYRQAATSTLERVKKPWRASYTSVSCENVRQAVSAGLGVGILPRSALGSSHHVLSPERGFPLLPDIEPAVIVSSNGNKKLAAQVADYLCNRMCCTARGF